MQASQRFIRVSAALFIGSAALTVTWCHSMPALHDLPMCSLQPNSLSGAPAFLVMWMAMMIAMMLPSLMPMLWRYRQAVATTSPSRLDALTGVVGFGYFFVWAFAGAFAFVGESTLAELRVHVPMLAGT